MLAFQDASVLIITDLYLSASTISYNSSVNTINRLALDRVSSISTSLAVKQQQIHKDNSDKKSPLFLIVGVETFS